MVVVLVAAVALLVLVVVGGSGGVVAVVVAGGGGGAAAAAAADAGANAASASGTWQRPWRGGGSGSCSRSSTHSVLVARTILGISAVLVLVMHCLRYMKTTFCSSLCVQGG